MNTLKLILLAATALLAGPLVAQNTQTALTMPAELEYRNEYTGQFTVTVPCYRSPDTVTVEVIEGHGNAYQGPLATVIFSVKNVAVVSDGSGGWQATVTFSIQLPGDYTIRTTSPGPDIATKPKQEHRRGIRLTLADEPDE